MATAAWTRERIEAERRSFSASAERHLFAKDRLGFGCPVGSHIRRSNPRDGLAWDLDRTQAARTGKDAVLAGFVHEALRFDPLAPGRGTGWAALKTGGFADSLVVQYD